MIHPTDDDVREQTARILGSRAFANAPLLRKFLEHVVLAVLSGRASTLKEYGLGVDVFGRGPTFDPRVDTIVRVQARRLRAKLDEYYRLEGRGDALVISIPKGGYAPVFDSAGPTPSPVSPLPGDGPNPAAPGGQLPVPRTSLIGRVRELDFLTRLVRGSRARLVTLTGAGGSGKTRLAVEVVRSVATEFLGGVVFVPLASVTTPDAVTATVAQVLGLRHTGGRPVFEALVEYVRRAVRQRTLLFLDNFEHVLAAAPCLARLLDAADALQIVVTSRAALRVVGEHEVPVAPLALPSSSDLRSVEMATSNPAMALFVERAAGVRPGFTLTRENAVTIAQICRGLDGLPLALELAAARIKVFPPAAILARLERSLEFLTSGPRDLPARQQTLRKTIDWSYDLLSPAEQMLFRRLSVFRGGCTLEGAEAVCNTRRDLPVDVVDGMASLVDKSLIQPTDDDHDEARFTMLETVREYGLERLTERGEDAATLRALTAYCLVLAEEGNQQLTDAERDEWLQRCSLEHENFRAALEHVVATRAADWGLRFVVALYAFWDRGEHLAEGLRWTETVLNLPDAAARTRLRAKALTYIGAFRTNQGDLDHSKEAEREALEIFEEQGDLRGVASMFNTRAVPYVLQNRWSEARDWFERSLAVARQLNDGAATAAVASNLADVMCAQGEFDLARQLLEEASATFVALGDARGVAWSHSHLADVARERGDGNAARLLYEQALAGFHAVGDAWGMGRAFVDLGLLAGEEGAAAQAAGYFEEALRVFVGLRHRRGVAKALEGIAALAAKEGQLERAFVMTGAAASLRTLVGAPPRPREKARLDQVLEPARQRSPGAAEAAWARGANMTLTDAIDYARTALVDWPPLTGTRPDPPAGEPRRSYPPVAS